MNTPDNRDETLTALESERTLPKGTLLANRYRVEALVGVGGMGMVYKAYDLELGLSIAVKVMRPELAAEQQMMERFRRELVLARQVSHRNVVRIHDIASDAGRLFLTMDFIDGRSLNDILDKDGPLPPLRAAGIVRQLAEALAAAHREGVVHRDLKPANVLIDDADRAYITDFGIARSIAASGLTQAGRVVGTPDYLSPEQARGEEVDGRSDIYALGLLLYRMLTNELPFNGSTYEEVLAQHTTGRLRDISRTGVAVPGWLRRVVNRCLQRTPVDRYQDAADLAEDLAQARSIWRPQRRTVIAGSAAVLAAVAITSFIALPGLRAPLTGEVTAAQDSVRLQEPRHSVAVLPLQYEGEVENWVTSGISELLAIQLAESRDLQVVESGRLQQTLADLDIDADGIDHNETRRIAELLDVDRLVTGTVVGSAGAFRIQLRVLMSDRPDQQIMSLADEVTSKEMWFDVVDRLSASLRPALDAAPVTTRAGRLTDSIPALQSYTRGVTALRAGDSVGAVPLLEQSVAADPAFAAAWVRLSEAYAALGRDQSALDAADMAVSQLQPDSGRIAFEARAQKATLTGDREQAEKYLRQLLDAYPHDIETHTLLAETIGDSGRYEEAAAELAEIVRYDSNHPRAWYLLGKYSILSGDSQRAIDDYLVRALVIQNKLGNDQGRADAMNALGIAHHQLGELEQARHYYGRAAELREQIGDERGMATAISNVARLQIMQGDYDGARRQLELALRKLDRLGDRQGVANMHNEIGVLEEEIGNYQAALSRYRDALQLRERLGDQRAMAESYNNVGYSYYLLGEYDNASVYAQQALNAYKATGNRDGMMLAQQTRGLIEIARGKWTEATKAFLAALDTARQIDFPHAAAVSHGNLGFIAHLQGRYQAAAEGYDKAISIMDEVGDPRGVAEFSLHRATLDLDLGMNEAAAQHFARAESALQVANNHEQSAWLHALRARNDLLNGSPNALTDFDEAMEESRRSGSLLAELRVASAYLEALLVTEDSDRVLQKVGDFRARADALGNAASRLQMRVIEANAALLAGDQQRAASRINEALQLLNDVGEYAWGWRLYRLAAQAAASEVEADRAMQNARSEFARVRQGMNELQRTAFDSRFAHEELIAGTAHE